MAAITTLRPWIFGGAAYGVFSPKPFTQPVITQLRPWAFAGMRYGNFSGRTPQTIEAEILKTLVCHPAFLLTR